MPRKNNSSPPSLHKRAGRLSVGGKVFIDRDYAQFIRRKWMRVCLFILMLGIYSVVPIYLFVEGLIIAAVTVLLSVGVVLIIMLVLKKLSEQ